MKIRTLSAALALVTFLSTVTTPAMALPTRNAYGSYLCNEVSWWNRSGIQNLVCLFSEDEPDYWGDGYGN
jgi:hypothetical protein